MQEWVGCIDDFWLAMWDKLIDGIVEERRPDGTLVDYEVCIPEETFRVIGWSDDTDMQTDGPRPGRTIENGNEISELRDTQQAFHK